MKKRIILVAVLIMLVLVSGANAWPWDGDVPNVPAGTDIPELTDLIFEDLLYNNAGPTKGMAIYKVNNIYNHPILIDTEYIILSGAVNLETEKYFKEVIIEWNDSIPITETILNCITEANGTWCWNETVIIGYNTVPRERREWEQLQVAGPWHKIPAHYNGPLRFEVQYTEPAYQNTISIDWVPVTMVDLGFFDIGGTRIKQEKWAWWNVSWAGSIKFRVTSQNQSGSILEPIGIPTHNLTAVTSSPFYPIDLRLVTEAGQEVPSEFTNISGPNTQGLLGLLNSSVTVGTNYRVYYDGPNEAANYSCNLGWTPCWVSEESKSLFNYRNNFEDQVTNLTGIGSSSFGINTTNVYEGTYSAYITAAGDGSGAKITIPSLSSGMVYVSYRIAGVGDMVYIGNNDGFGDYMARHLDDGDDNIQIRDGGDTIPVSVINEDEYHLHQFNIDLDTQTYDYMLDASLNNSGLDVVTGSDGTEITQLQLAGEYGGRSNGGFIDNVYISTNEFYTYINTSIMYINSSLHAEIVLSSPADALVTYNSTIDHTFIFEHPNQTTATCILYYNDTQEDTGTTQNYTTTTLTATNVDNTTFEWWVTCNFPSGALNSTSTRTLTRIGPQLNITVYDEQNESRVLFDLTLINDTEVNNYTNITQHVANPSNTTTGAITANYINSNSEYRTRYYSFTQYTPGLSNYTFYLLKTSEGIVVRFHVVDPFGNGIQTALVEAYKNFGGTYEIVDSGLTDGSGTATLWLDPDTAYRIDVTFGAISTSQIITPTNNDFTITLGIEGGGINFVNPFNGRAVRLQPDTPSSRPICWAITPNESISWYSHDIFNTTTYFGLTVWINDTVMYNETVSNSSSGGFLEFTFNSSLYPVGTNITATGFSKWLNIILYERTRDYTVNNCNYTSTSLWGIITGPLGNTGMSDTGKAITAILICAFLTAGMAGFIGFRGGGLIGISLLGVFAYMGWFRWTLYFLIVGTYVATIVLARQGEY